MNEELFYFTKEQLVKAMLVFNCIVSTEEFSETEHPLEYAIERAEHLIEILSNLQPEQDGTD